MFNRLIRFILVGALLLQMGCSRAVYTIFPEPHQIPDLSLPCKVKVTLKSETALQGTYRDKTTTWQTDKISGKLVAWNGVMASIRTGSLKYRVPIEDIERIDTKEIDSRKGCLIAGAIAAVAATVYILLRIL